MLHARGRWLLAAGRPQEAADVLRRMPPAPLPGPGDLDSWAQRRDVALAECALALDDPAQALRLALGVTERLGLIESRHGSTLVHVHALAWRAAALAHLALGQVGPARAAVEQALRLRLEHDVPDSPALAELRALARRASSRG